MFTVNFVDTNQEAIDAGLESDLKQNNLVASLAMVPKSQGGRGCSSRSAAVSSVRGSCPITGI